METVNLKGKRILYIGPTSFHYDIYFVKKLTEFGASVTCYDLLSFFSDGILFRACIKLLPSKINVYEYYKTKFYNKIRSVGGYDFVLVRHGYQLDDYFLREMRTINPDAKFINFHWDALKPEYDYLSNLRFFDKVFSFDVKDCQDHPEIHYLPLFYLDIYETFRKDDEKKNLKKKNDILFIGAWRNKERLALIMKTEKMCRKLNLNFKHYLYLSFKNHIYTIKKGIIPRKTKMKQLSHNEMLEIFSQTKAIIDFPSSFQTGLTIRSFETLGAGKKLITTNKNIMNEPFYNPEFINIIDLDNFHIDTDFIHNIPESSIDDIMKNYSLGSYITKLFQ